LGIRRNLNTLLREFSLKNFFENNYKKFKVVLRCLDYQNHLDVTLTEKSSTTLASSGPFVKKNLLKKIFSDVTTLIQ